MSGSWLKQAYPPTGSADIYIRHSRVPSPEIHSSVPEAFRPSCAGETKTGNIGRQGGTERRYESAELEQKSMVGLGPSAISSGRRRHRVGGIFHDFGFMSPRSILNLLVTTVNLTPVLGNCP